MKNLINFREFKKTDWDAWAGAEAPAGREPMIGEVEVLGVETKVHDFRYVENMVGEIVCDANCIEIQVVTDNFEHSRLYRRNFYVSIEFDKIIEFAARLGSKVKESELLIAGFEIY